MSTAIIDPVDTLIEQHRKLPQVECPVTHRFAPGVYLREIFMPAGTFVIGHRHNTTHFNVVVQGEALVSIDGEASRIKAPFTFVSEAGCRKVLYIIKDMIWQTIHTNDTNEESIEVLENRLVIKTNATKQSLLEVDKLKRLAESQTP